MNKLMSIFGVILFAFALTLTSCDSGSEEASTSETEVADCGDDCAKECCATEESSTPETEVAACADECAKACCLGCKATEGEADCELLSTKDHSCCVPAPEATEEAPHDETVPHTH